MSLNTILLIIGVVLLVLAGVAYFGGIMGGAALPLLIVGVLAVVAGLLIRGS